ncbi:MAG TPA: hypothetical protein VJB89_00735 [Candidatus Nanoarchaeia archaeon]|nr:hypothetical protein [Candidatus Nanoarchaeia archaeon]
MIKTILGIILFLSPFLLINNFKDKKRAFFYILSFIIGFHLSLAIITQLFGIFDYKIIILVNFILAIFVISKTNFKLLFINIKKLKIDYFFIILVIILAAYLYQIHYSYDGTLNTISPDGRYSIELEDFNSNFTYFSDEWIAISLIKYSINSGKLPLVNPLWYNENFINVNFSFHSFLSYLVLIFDMNPLTQYVLLTFFSGLTICLLVYFILRFNSIDKFSSTIASISVLYIVNGANLPGMWVLIPLIMSIICLLLSFLFITFDDYKMVLYTNFLTIIFYPPTVIFSFFSFIFYIFYSEKLSKSEKKKIIFYYISIIIFTAIFISFLIRLFVINDTSLVLEDIKNKIFFESYTGPAIDDFSIYRVLPLFTLFFALIGVFVVNNKKFWLNATLFIGLIYWIIYSSSINMLIIGYPRVVFTTSVIIIIISGFGINYTVSYLEKTKFFKKYNKKYQIIRIIQIIVLFLFFILAFSYTERDNWEELKLYYPDGDYISPAPPANMYLIEDDLTFFSDIHQKRFLSDPWKGLVIGTATNNYPLVSKDSTITNEFLDYYEFLDADCLEKGKIFEENEIDYFYGEEINCSGFDFINKSSQDFYLYEYKR